jgi:hypothetical protein
MTQTNYGGKRLKRFKNLKSILCAFFIVAAFISIGAAYRSGTEPELQPSEIALQQKIEAYKKFKARYEDKDFQLDSYPVRRMEHVNGKSNAYSFNIYRITYGIIADNIKEYGKSRKQIVQNPTNLQMGKKPDCRHQLYVEDYTGFGKFLTCLEDAEHTYPISLLLDTLTAEELKDVAIIYEFNDGDLDIQFSLDKGSDKTFVESLYLKLKQADEQHDEKRQEVSMAPIIPTRNQRITSSFIDEDNDGELDYALVPYCVNGSFFDDDPDNNAIQIALKYNLVTRKDLQGKTLRQRQALEKRMGLWKWDNPSEILTSFTEHPGPDIVFYDLGTVVNSRIIDPKPDGKFDKYEFLY